MNKKITNKNMKRLSLLVMITATIVLTNSCRLYKPYERPSVNDKGLYRDTINNADTLAVKDSLTFGNLPWQEVFTDSYLQQLIDKGLENNTDLLKASLSITEAEAQLKTARLAFYPSFTFAGSGTVSSWDYQKASQVYSLPVESSWVIDLFGSLTNAKRAQKVNLLMINDYQQAVRVSLIANIANCYYTLLMLDKQLEITEQTASLTKKTWDMMEAQKKYSRANEAAVQSSKANYYAVMASIPELKRQIRETENSLSLMLGQSPQTVGRNKLENQSLPKNISTGLPVQLLSNRPDVHSAEMALANCYYQTNVARAAFYPNLTITGSAGWTNYTGSYIINPGKMLAAAVGSLTQPIFENGKLKAALKVAKAEQQKAYLDWQYSILNAGSEVSNALMLYQSSTQKSFFEQKQIESLERNVEVSKKLFNLGSSSYLEVISAQQYLLNAQISKISDDFYKMQSVVNLYYALGGGKEIKK
jgi:NodT family efflux transporter outer membrane factor (OMF) lipoprotein